MHILNLGAGGFIGSHLTHRLLAEGHSVTAVDLWSDKVEDLLSHPRLKFIQQDIRAREWNLDALVDQGALSQRQGVRPHLEGPRQPVEVGYQLADLLRDLRKLEALLPQLGGQFLVLLASAEQQRPGPLALQH